MNTKTEKVLAAGIGILFFALTFNFFAKDAVTSLEVFAKSEGSGSEESSESEDSGDSESEDSESEDSESEESSVSQKSVQSLSEPSAASIKKVSPNSSAGNLKSGTPAEDSGQGAAQEAAAVPAVGGEGEVSEESEPSELSLDGYEVVSVQGDTVLVKHDEKLFFLIPVEIESEVTVDEEGNVLEEKQDFVNWLLSLLSNR